MSELGLSSTFVQKTMTLYRPQGAPVHLETKDSGITTLVTTGTTQGVCRNADSQGSSRKSESVGPGMWPQGEFLTSICWENYYYKHCFQGNSKAPPKIPGFLTF